jgi:hypothetical protein
MSNPTILLLFFSCFLVGCATERTATGDPIESGTVNYEISEEELDAYISKDERVTFFGGFYPNDAIRAKFKVNLDRDPMQSFVIAALEDVGWVYKVRENEPVAEIVGIVNSGLLNMNKSSFWIGLQRVGNDTIVSILAVAFEGLIKQNTNGKALERFILSLEKESGLKVNLLKLDP